MGGAECASDSSRSCSTGLCRRRARTRRTSQPGRPLRPGSRSTTLGELSCSRIFVGRRTPAAARSSPEHRAVAPLRTRRKRPAGGGPSPFCLQTCERPRSALGRCAWRGLSDALLGGLRPPTALSLMFSSSAAARRHAIPRSSEPDRSTQHEGWRQAQESTRMSPRFGASGGGATNPEAGARSHAADRPRLFLCPSRGRGRAGLPA